MSADYIDRLPGSEPGDLRRKALQAFYGVAAEPTSLIEYRSAGAVLVVCPFRSVGDEERAVALAARFAAPLQVTLLLTGVAAGEDFELRELAAEQGVRLETAERAAAEGYLGDFAVRVEQAGQSVELARRVLDRDGFDILVDASDTPLLMAELPPPGYYAVRNDPALVEAALAEIPELVGEFQKPKFVNYDAAICAHTRSGKIGCTRCLDACPTGALTHQEDAIAVDLHLCQGAGPCASVCPSGAITYLYPPAKDLLTALREALYSYAEGEAPVLLLHDADAGHEFVTAKAAAMPAWLLPLELAEAGTAGAEFWLAALAWGAAGVRQLVPDSTPPSVRAALQSQLGWVGPLLQACGLPADSVQLVDADSALSGPAPAVAARARARHGAFPGKRNNLALALDHLGAGVGLRQAVALPDAAPLGRVEVDTEKCTLCMACVSACPASALLAGDGSPRLRFVEDNCLQCGLCRETCPESAIGLRARWNPDANLRRAVEVLHQDEPLKCIVCGKEFGNKRMVEAMQAKLGQHWMYQNPTAMRRLQMCENCRVLDMHAHGMMNVYDKP